jgi:hypothetical protein
MYHYKPIDRDGFDIILKCPCGDTAVFLPERERRQCTVDNGLRLLRSFEALALEQHLFAHRSCHHFRSRRPRWWPMPKQHPEERIHDFEAVIGTREQHGPPRPMRRDGA